MAAMNVWGTMDRRYEVIGDMKSYMVDVASLPVVMADGLW